MATIADLTEHLGKRDGSLGAVLEIFPDMIFVVDQEERVLHANALAARALGGTSDEFIGRKLNTLFPPPLAERHSRFIQQVFRTGEIVVTETHQELHKTPVWIDSRLVPLKAAGGEVRAVVGIIRDVSVRVRAQEALAEREAYLRAVLDNFPFLV
jgi:PAS domain S-box-containing protein